MQHYTVLSKQRSKMLYKQQHTVTEQQLFEAKVRPSMQSKNRHVTAMYSFKYIPTITSTFFEMSMLLTMVYKGNAKATIFCLKQQQIQPKNDSQFIRKPESLTVLWSGCSKANQLKSDFTEYKDNHCSIQD